PQCDASARLSARTEMRRSMWALGPTNHNRARSLCRLRSPLPGNGISRAEKNAPIRRLNHGSAVSETKRSHNKPANSRPFSTTTGNLRNRRNAWWAREDSPPPEHLSPAEVEIWKAVLGSRKAGHFGPEIFPLLVAYSTTAAACDHSGARL